MCLSRNLYATFSPFWIAVCANIIGIIKRWSFGFLLCSSFYISFNNVPNAFHIYLLFLFFNEYVYSLTLSNFAITGRCTHTNHIESETWSKHVGRFVWCYCRIIMWRWRRSLLSHQKIHPTNKPIAQLESFPQHFNLAKVINRHIQRVFFLSSCQIEVGKEHVIKPHRNKMIKINLATNFGYFYSHSYCYLMNEINSTSVSFFCVTFNFGIKYPKWIGMLLKYRWAFYFNRAIIYGN